MRQVQHRLRKLLEHGRSHFVEQDGEDNRDGEAEEQVQPVENQCVLQRDAKVAHAENELEVVQPNPLALGGIEHVILLESNLKPRHRLVAEQNVPDNWNQQHQVQPPVALKPVFLALAARMHRGSGFRGICHKQKPPFLTNYGFRKGVQKQLSFAGCKIESMQRTRCFSQQHQPTSDWHCQRETTGDAARGSLLRERHAPFPYR